MNRRRFLQRAGMGAVAVGAVGATGYGTRGGLARAIIRRFLHGRMDGMNVSSEVIEAFARDVVAVYGPMVSAALSVPDGREKLEVLFLLSTNFFENGADGRRPVRYIALADPYVRTCPNPFA